MLLAPDGEVGHANQDRSLSVANASEVPNADFTGTGIVIDCSNAAGPQIARMLHRQLAQEARHVERRGRDG